MPLLGGHLKGGLKAHELMRRSSPYDIMAILIFASPEGAGQRASECLILIQVDTFMSNNKMCFDYGKEEKSSKNK